MSFVEFRNVTKFYQMGEQKIAAADGVDFVIEKGEFTVIVGPSGAGKTTVLNMLGGMDSCSGGEIWLDGNLVSSYTRKQLTEYHLPPVRRGVCVPVLQSGAESHGA